jgi:type II secretory pathway component PulF
MTGTYSEPVERRLRQFLSSVESALKADGKSSEHRALIRDELEQQVRSNLAALTCAVTLTQLEAILERMDQPQAYGHRTAMKWGRIVEWSFPAFLSVVTIGINGIAFLIQGILVPKLEIIFKELNLALPALTTFLIVSTWAYLLPLIFICACVVVVARLRKTGTNAWLVNTALSLAILLISGLYLVFQVLAVVATAFSVTETLGQQT